jgi:L-ribulose-5-phosphate 4-epimerase
MTPEALREDVCAANRAIAAAGLVTLAFGNVSGIDRATGVVVIKPSGIACDRVEPDQLVAVEIESGTPLSSDRRPSSDTPTHLAIYRRWPAVGGIVHTHSPGASAWAQAARTIPCFGTTHADYFRGAVPVTRALATDEIEGAYEAETGHVIIEAIEALGIPPMEMPAALVRGHGPFTWGVDAADAVLHAIALEAVSALAAATLALDPDAPVLDDQLRERHFRRKHGPAAYYGQVVRR